MQGRISSLACARQPKRGTTNRDRRNHFGCCVPGRENSPAGTFRAERPVGQRSKCGRPNDCPRAALSAGRKSGAKKRQSHLRAVALVEISERKTVRAGPVRRKAAKRALFGAGHLAWTVWTGQLWRAAERRTEPRGHDPWLCAGVMPSSKPAEAPSARGAFPADRLHRSRTRNLRSRISPSNNA